MPSSVIEGTYRDNSMTLNTSRRHVIATAGPDKYLVSLSVTTSVDQVVAAADATDAIANGFRVSLPAAADTRRAAPPPRRAQAGPAGAGHSSWDCRGRHVPRAMPGARGTPPDLTRAGLVSFDPC